MISYGEERRAGALAAGLAFSVVKNRAFLDGNKRTGSEFVDWVLARTTKRAPHLDR